MIGGSLREAAFDFYYNSWRLVPANVLWAVLLFLILGATLVWLPSIALLTVLALPVAGMFRMAVLIQRGASVALADFWTGMRRFAVPALALGFASTFAAIVFTSNIAIGIATPGIAGGIFAMFAAYADIGLAMYLLAAWPILVDPVRETEPISRRLRVAFYVVVTRAGRMLALTLVVGLLVAVSTILFAALFTITLAYISLVATHYVLPAADRLEGRATVPLPG
jgi:hypothetical protein